MDGIISLMEDLCGSAICAGIYAGLLAIIVLLINVLFRRWLSPGQLGLMWGLVLLRLLIPLGPSSDLSLESLLSHHEIDAAASRPVDATQAPYAALKATTQPLTQTTQAATLSQVESTPWIDWLLMQIPWIWFVGGAIGLVWTLASHWRFCRRVKQSPTCTDQRLLRLWAECCEQARVKGQGVIVLFDGVDQPAIMGLFRRRLLLPSHTTELGDEPLRMIMFHELAHVKRWDIAANWALVAIRAIHWWNPIYWLAASRFRSLREQACDAYVVRQLANASVAQYSELLLKLAQSPAAFWSVKLPASILGFFPSAFRSRSIRVRLKALRTAGFEPGRWHATGILGVTILLAISGLTNARVDETPIDIPTYMARARISADALQKSYHKTIVFEGLKTTRSYDIEKALQRITGNSMTIDEAQKKIERALAVMFRAKCLSSAEATPSDDKRADGNDSKPQMTFNIRDKVLTAHAPSTLHEALVKTFEAWAESGLGQIAVSPRVVRAQRDLAPEVGITWQSLEAFAADQVSLTPSPTGDHAPSVRAAVSVEDYLPIVITTLTESQTNAFLDLAQGDRRTNLLQAPTATIFNGQEAIVADCTVRPFVVGVRQPVPGANQPTVVVIEEGTTIRLRGVQSRDHKNVHLDASFKMSSVAEVATASTTFGGRPVTIQIPRVNRRTIEVSSDLPIGHTVLIGCLPTAGKNEYFYYLLTTRRVSERGTKVDFKTSNPLSSGG